MPEEAQESRPRVSPQPIEDELHRSYIDYAMSVIVGRALPDVRDGLKPVQRRILHAMNELGMSSQESRTGGRRVSWQMASAWRPRGVRCLGADGSELLVALPAHRWPRKLGEHRGRARRDAIYGVPSCEDRRGDARRP